MNKNTARHEDEKIEDNKCPVYEHKATIASHRCMYDENLGYLFQKVSFSATENAFLDQWRED